MSNQPLFAVSQLTRANRFSVSTYLVEKDGERFFIKKANTLQSKDHLMRMVETYSDLVAKKALLTLISPVPSEKLRDGSIQFPYIAGGNVERLLLMSILEKRDDDAIAIINRLLSIVDSLSVQHYNPSEDADFSRIFRGAYNYETACVKPGIIDLNLDNIIEDAVGKWHLIDYEWVFNFPVPKEYIVRRFFYWFFVQRYRDLLSYHAERIKHVTIGPDVSVPAFVHAAYPWAFEGLDKVIQTEMAFQEYVLGREIALDRISFFATPRPRKATQQLSLLDAYLKQPDLLEQVAQLKSMDKRERELRMVQRTFAYRLARKILSIRTKVSKKLQA